MVPYLQLIQTLPYLYLIANFDQNSSNALQPTLYQKVFYPQHFLEFMHFLSLPAFYPENTAFRQPPSSTFRAYSYNLQHEPFLNQVLSCSFEKSLEAWL